jgi:hypothetical protein
MTAVMAKTGVIPAMVVAPTQGRNKQDVLTDTAQGIGKTQGPKTVVQFLVVMPMDQKGTEAAEALLNGPLELPPPHGKILEKAMASCQQFPVQSQKLRNGHGGRAKRSQRPWEMAGWRANETLMAVGADGVPIWVPLEKTAGGKPSLAAISAAQASTAGFNSKDMESMAAAEAAEAATAASRTVARFTAAKAVEAATATILQGANPEERDEMQAAIEARQDAMAIVEVAIAPQTTRGSGDADFTFRVTPTTENVRVKAVVHAAMKDESFGQAVGDASAGVYVAMAKTGGGVTIKKVQGTKTDGPLVKDCQGWIIGDADQAGDIRLLVMGPEAKGAAKGTTPQEFREEVAGKWAKNLPSTSKGAKRAPSVHRISPRKKNQEEVSSGDMAPGSPTGLSDGVGKVGLASKSAASKRSLASEEDGSGSPKKMKQGQTGEPMEADPPFFDAANDPNSAEAGNGL